MLMCEREKDGREREREKGMKKEASAVLRGFEDRIAAVAERVASGIHRSTFLSEATDRYGTVFESVTRREHVYGGF